VIRTLDAIYEGSKLVLPEPLPLAEKSHVRVTIQTESAEAPDPERQAWLLISEESLLKTWGNSGDDVFNELLKK
jgi:hypothetical protein